MGDIKKINKFDSALERLNEQEEQESIKSKKVVQAITGSSSGMASSRSTASTRKKEERKATPVYIPVSMFQQFAAINAAYGISNNAAINMLVRDYITEKKGVLDNI